MIVAVPGMRVVQATVHQIVDMIAVRHPFVAAARTMLMLGAAPCAPVAIIRVRPVNRDRMLLDAAAAILVMEVAIVQIVDMAVVTNGGMPAAWPVYVIVVGVVVRCRHGSCFPFPLGFDRPLAGTAPAIPTLIGDRSG